MDISEIIGILVPVAVAIIASIPGILAYWGARRKARAENKVIESSADKTGAETADVYVGIATSLVVALRDRIKDLEDREMAREDALNKLRSTVTAFRERLENAERINMILCEGLTKSLEQIASLGLEPVFVMPEDLCAEAANGNGEIYAGSFDT